MAGQGARLDDLEARLARIEGAISQASSVAYPGPGTYPGPGPIVDPAPFPWPQPLPWPFPRPQPMPWPQPLPQPWPWPQPGDPSPIDLSRFSAGQLESMLHNVNAERARLDSMEKMVKDRLGGLKKGK